MNARRSKELRELNYAYAARHVRTPKEEAEMREMDDLDIECKMPLEKFKAYCKSGAFMDSDGFGYYADEDMVSRLYANPWDFKHGFIRDDFKFVCWYNN